MTPLTGIRACLFDAYGTLLDVHAAAKRESEAQEMDLARLSAVWRQKQLEYTWLRSLMGRYANFEQITADALDYALDSEGLADPQRRERLLALYRRLDAYSDARECLLALRDRGLTTAILSNGSPAMLDAAVEAAGLTPLLDQVLSVDALGVYKPDPRVYRLAVERLKTPADAILFVSANGWDAAGAAAFGFPVAWLNRAAAPPERLDARPDRIIATLDEIGALLGSP